MTLNRLKLSVLKEFLFLINGNIWQLLFFVATIFTLFSKVFKFDFLPLNYFLIEYTMWQKQNFFLVKKQHLESKSDLSIKFFEDRTFYIFNFNDINFKILIVEIVVS